MIEPIVVRLPGEAVITLHTSGVWVDTPEWSAEFADGGVSVVRKSFHEMAYLGFQAAEHRYDDGLIRGWRHGSIETRVGDYNDWSVSHTVEAAVMLARRAEPNVNLIIPAWSWEG
jgi:hypothetical protein